MQLTNNYFVNHRLWRAIDTSMLWIFVAIMLAVLPHVQRTSVWIPLVFFWLILWRLFMSTNKSGLLNFTSFSTQVIRLVTAFGIVIGTLVNYGSLVGRDAGVALLILLAGMKFLEIRQLRDYYIMAFIGLFLILTNFLYSQSIPTALYTLIAVTFFIATLISFNDSSNFLKKNERLYVAGSMLLQAFPLMLVIFLLFPRVPGPLWGLPKDAHAGLSGLSDEMSPGSISDLTLSDEIVFRVEFQGSVPDKSLLYWRGPVLWQTDGVRWVQDKPRQYSPPISIQGVPVTYAVTLEPTDNHWLFGLELPEQPPEDGFFTHDLQIKTKQRLRNRTRYTLTSYTNFHIGADSHEELSKALQLPEGYHSKTVALAKSWRTQGLDDLQIINHVLNMFNQEEFYYTLTPPLLLQDTVDEFLFETRQGFCEHYSAAFTVLMRAAGIPARVVMGYQGGTINSVGNYMIVRQRDAHAWVEIWQNNRGWIRIDPTSAVAPLRIREGIENALPDSIIDVPLGLQNNAIVRGVWRQLRDTVDAINNRWNQWVIAYDMKRQRILLSRMGLGEIDWREMIVILAFIVAITFIFVYFWLFRQNNRQTDSARILYEKFCTKLAKLGIVRYANEGPKDFANRAIFYRSDLTNSIRQITDLYIAVRYRSQIDIIDKLKQYIMDFHPGKKALD